MKKMKSPYLNNEYIIRSNNMALKKEVAKKILKTIKPKPKPKPKVRRAQGQPAPGTRVGTMQNPAVVPKPKSKAMGIDGKNLKLESTLKAAGIGGGAAAKKRMSNTAKGALAAILAAGTVITSKGKRESFDDAFRKARAKGEGTKFTHKGKKFTAVTKDDMKNKGYSSLAAYNKAGGVKKATAKNVKSIVDQVNKNKKRKRPLINAAKRVLLGKDKKFGGDRGLIDFLGKRKKKNPGVGIISKPDKKADGGMMKYKDGGSVSPKRSSKRGVGAAKRGFGKALR